MFFVGFLGPAGAGKHLAAAAFAAVLDENGYSSKLDSFGRDIKRALWGADGLVDKKADRRAMQILGAEKRRQDPLCLVNSLAVRNNVTVARTDFAWGPADFLLSADIRDENELWFFRDRGSVVLVRGSFDRLEGVEAEHESEQLAARVKDEEVDYIIPKQKSKTLLMAAAADIARRHIAFLKGAVHA